MTTECFTSSHFRVIHYLSAGTVNLGEIITYDARALPQFARQFAKCFQRRAPDDAFEIPLEAPAPPLTRNWRESPSRACARDGKNTCGAPPLRKHRKSPYVAISMNRTRSRRLAEFYCGDGTIPRTAAAARTSTPIASKRVISLLHTLRNLTALRRCGHKDSPTTLKIRYSTI